MTDLVVPCPACGAKNRKQLAKLSDRPVCAKCGAALPRGGGPVEVSGPQFEAALKLSQVPVLVDFWAEWCGPCRAFAPVLARYAAARADDLLVLKVDTDAVPDVARRYQISAIPTAMLFRGPVEVARQAGAMPPSALDQWVRGALAR